MAVGDVIAKGQVVARIRQEELLRQIQDSRDKLADARVATTRSCCASPASSGGCAAATSPSSGPTSSSSIARPRAGGASSPGSGSRPSASCSRTA